MADSVAAVSMGALVSGNRIVYAKRLRDKGERATTRYHSQEFPRSASDGEMTAPPDTENSTGDGAKYLALLDA